MTTLATRLKQLRTDRGLSYRAACEKIGCSLSSLQNWEAGEYEPGAEHIANICRAYRTTPNKLLDWKR